MRAQLTGFEKTSTYRESEEPMVSDDPQERFDPAIQVIKNAGSTRSYAQFNYSRHLKRSAIAPTI